MTRLLAALLLPLLAVTVWLSCDSMAYGEEQRCRPPKGAVCRVLKQDKYNQVRRALVADGMYWAWRSGLAQRIIDCETGGTWNPWAIGTLGELGLWQIWPKYHVDKFDGPWYSPYWNTEAAVDVYREAGYSFSPWSCYQ